MSESETKHILIIEDEEDILELLTYNLGKEGYRTSSAATGESGIHSVRTVQPDLILLDLMLPGINGLDVCRVLKSDPQFNRIPIIMVTAKGEESDIVQGLELGADDYITKPFGVQVLLARIKAVLRRKTPVEEDRAEWIALEGLTIHPGRHEVRVDGELVHLTSTEFRVLEFLASRPGWVFTRNQIVQAVHDEAFVVTERAIDVQIVGLRKKLGQRKYIETVRGVGYRFKG